MSKLEAKEIEVNYKGHNSCELVALGFECYLKPLGQKSWSLIGLSLFLYQLRVGDFRNSICSEPLVYCGVVCWQGVGDGERRDQKESGGGCIETKYIIII